MALIVYLGINSLTVHADKTMQATAAGVMQLAETHCIHCIVK